MPRSVLLLLLVPAIALAQRGPAAPAGPPPAAAMPAEAAARYHEAARLYVDGQNAPALAAAEAAVALAPESRRAVALRDLIKEQQDQQNPDPQDQPQDQQEPQDQPQNQNSDDPNEPPPGQNGQPPPDEGSPAPSDRPGEPRDGMTRDQAERILDAVGGDERQLLRRFRREPSRVRTNEQDW